VMLFTHFFFPVLCTDHARLHCIDRYSMLCILHCCTSHIAYNACFRRTVNRTSRVARNVPCDGRGENQPSIFLFFHCFQHRFCCKEKSFQVYILDFIPVRLCHILNHHFRINPCIGCQNINFIVLFEDIFHDLFSILGICDIQPEELTIYFFCCSSSSFLVNVADHHFRTRFSQRLRTTFTDTICAACHHCDVILQIKDFEHLL